VSLATYLESPLLYSFPEQGRTQPLSFQLIQNTFWFGTIMAVGDAGNNLQSSSKKLGFSFLKKLGVKTKGPSISMWVNPVNAHQHMSRRSVLDNPPHLPACKDVTWAQNYSIRLQDYSSWVTRKSLFIALICWDCWILQSKMGLQIPSHLRWDTPRLFIKQQIMMPTS